MGAAHVQERRYSAHDAYSTSKLAMMLITAEHAQRLGGRGATVNCLDPGTVNTSLLEKGKPKLCNFQAMHFFAQWQYWSVTDSDILPVAQATLRGSTAWS